MYTVLITLTTLHSEIIITRSRREYAENVEKKKKEERNKDRGILHRLAYENLISRSKWNGHDRCSRGSAIFFPTYLSFSTTKAESLIVKMLKSGNQRNCS